MQSSDIQAQSLLSNMIFATEPVPNGSPPGHRLRHRRKTKILHLALEESAERLSLFQRYFLLIMTTSQ